MGRTRLFRARSLPRAKRGGALAMTTAFFLFATLAARLQTALAAEEITDLQASFLKEDYGQVRRKAQEFLDRRPAPSGEEEEGLLYLLGVSALKLGDLEPGRSVLQQLIQKYPQGRWAPQAAAVLGSAEEFFFSVQVGAFRTRENALRVKRECERRGHPAQVSKAEMDGERFHRVRVGRFASRAEAQQEADRLESQGIPGKVVP